MCRQLHHPVGLPPPPPLHASCFGCGCRWSGLGVGLAKKGGAAEGGLEGQVFSSNDTEFTKSFFETTFSEFFRAVPSPKIKGLVLAFKTVKKEVVATRITRISASEGSLPALPGAQEVTLAFWEIATIEVKRK